MTSQDVHVWIMTSWTKIWSCTGVRLGSVVAPTAAKLAAVKAKQVPWSVNCVALVSRGLRHSSTESRVGHGKAGEGGGVLKCTSCWAACMMSSPLVLHSGTALCCHATLIFSVRVDWDA